MPIHQESLAIHTSGRGLLEITTSIAACVARAHVITGFCTVFLRHTSAGLVLQENADPSARLDLEAWLQRLAPDGDPLYTHRAEGPDDMAAHLQTVLTSSSISIPITSGELALGTWQGLFLAEHRTSPQKRSLVIHIAGD
ncbi:MAG: secondary thiamine-phosphate synthase enzyme YjbQ [Planctomycetota bacterium]|nr:secondary thiamine-phosphate synthase enzyme YjbQ [Planctomycetota bacterium]